MPWPLISLYDPIYKDTSSLFEIKFGFQSWFSVVANGLCQASVRILVGFSSFISF